MINDEDVTGGSTPEELTMLSPVPVEFVDINVIVSARLGTAYEANSRIGACQIPNPTMKTAPKINTATIALGSLTRLISGDSSMYIFRMIQA